MYQFDEFSRYEAGLQQLLTRIGRDHPRYAEALVYQQRLIENINLARRYGDTQDRQAKRSEVSDRLTELALSELDLSFNELCSVIAPADHSGQHLFPGDVNRSDKRSLRLEHPESFNKRQLAAATQAKVRARYLRWLADDVGNRLAVSIHRARFIDLGLTERRAATRPWTYKSYWPDEKPQSFESFEDAYAQNRRRILLLGMPGAGKTTTLLDTAQKLIQEAQADERAPIPLLLNLSQWRNTDERSARNILPPALPLSRFRKAQPPTTATSFGDWLVAMATDQPGAGLSEAIARDWVSEDHVALLLDGLDEVDEQRRPGLVRAINEHLKAHPDMPVVVCSRVVDYEPLQATKETRVALNGAVTLQPLTGEQINAYLTAAGATALRDALPGDSELYELAQTPLTLSMMALAYGGALWAAIPANLSLSERRRHLFDVYIDRMMQRKVRRDAADPDLHLESFNPAEDLPARYIRARVDRYLGWLAIRLIERSRAVFRYDGLYKFLAEQSSGRLWEVPHLTQAFAIFLFTMLLALAVLAQTSGDVGAAMLPALAIGVAGTVSYCISLSFAQLTRINAIPDWLETLLGVVILFLALIGASAFLVGLVLLSLVHVPLQIGNLLLLIVPDGWGFRQVRAPDGTTTWLLISLPMIGALLGGLAALIAAVGAFWATMWRERSQPRDRRERLMLPVMLALALLLLVPLAMGIGALLGWSSALALSTLGDLAGPLGGAVFIGIAVALTDEERIWPPLLFIVGMVLGVVLGGALGGAPGGMLGGILAIVLISVLYAVYPNIISRLDPIFDTIERIIFDPIARALLILSGNIPANQKAFLNYAADALLLKRSGADYEFIHRLLRDHFALHGWQTKNDDEYVWLGWSQMSAGDHIAALESSTRAIEMNPRKAMAFACRGETYYFRERYEEALVDLTRALELDPDDTVLAYRGATYRLLGRYEEALSDLTRALELDPKDAWTLANRGVTYREWGRSEDALSDLTRALELDPKDAWALANRGAAYCELARYEEALSDLTRALELNPDYAWALAQQGKTYRLLGRYEEALSDLTRALELDPKDAWTLANRGETYRLLGRYEEALSDLDRAIALDSTLAWALGSRGATYRLLERYEEALSDLDRAIALDPAYFWGLAQRGVTYRLLERYEEALSDLTRALELNPDYAWAYAQRGKTYRQLEQYELALADFYRAIELAPSDDRYWYGRAQTHLCSGHVGEFTSDLNTAIDLAQAALRDAPDDNRLSFSLALYHLLAGHVEEAEAQYDRLLAICLSVSRLKATVSDLVTVLAIQPSNELARRICDRFSARVAALNGLAVN